MNDLSRGLLGVDIEPKQMMLSSS